MALSIQAQNSLHTIAVGTLNWVKVFVARRIARRTKSHAIKQLRVLDPHLVNDLGLDEHALWQPRPEIRLLHSPYQMTKYK